MAVRRYCVWQCHVFLTRSLPITVLEMALSGGTSDPPEPSRITIKFALVVEARGDVNENELQATDALNRATKTVGTLRPVPQIVGRMRSAIGIGTKVGTELQTFENTWDVLLKRMALFNKIVAGVAEVSRIRRFVPSPSECRIDSPVYVVGLVGDIGGEPGMCVARHSHRR